MKKILVVEDNEDIAETLALRLRIASYEVAVYHDGYDVLTVLHETEHPPDGIVLDLMLPGRSGYELLSSIKGKWPEVRVFIFSSHQELEKTFPRTWIEGFFIKTDGIEKLIEAMDRVLK
ncbi:MAG: response regulator [Candidatus Omnitrophica bacterium]|nr:response regulator [Candidatus Omnitrophota bacterium]